MVLRLLATITISLLCSSLLLARTNKSWNEEEINKHIERVTAESSVLTVKIVELIEAGFQYEEREDWDNTLKCFSHFLANMKQFMQKSFSIMLLDEQQYHMTYLTPLLEHFKDIGSKQYSQNPAWGDLMADCELLSKSLFLESTNRVKFASIKSEDTLLVDLWKLYEELKHQQSKIESCFAVLESDSTYVAAQNAYQQGEKHILSNEIQRHAKAEENLQKMNDTIKLIEERIILRLALSEKSQINFTTSWQDVRSALSDNQATIEFLLHSKLSDSNTIFYSAVIIRKNTEHPVIIPIIDEQQLSIFLQYNRFDPTALHGTIWSPIEKHLDGIDELFISASGAMSLIPFASIQNDNKQLCDTYAIRNVISPKDIIRLSTDSKANIADQGYALFFGGAEFGLLQQQDRNSSKTRGQGFDYLPGAKKEVINCAKSLTKAGWRTDVYTDESATEGRLRESLNNDSISILHIATHGFIMPKPHKNVTNLTMEEIKSAEKAILKYSTNPLLRTGLLFSGANQFWQGKMVDDDANDGIITGNDISQFNLLDTKLVVLSACHTGLGEIDHSEGVYGLQRAFRIAGARKMVVTLWDIPDKETSEFMTHFYSSLTQKRPINIAFANAQKSMKKKYPNHPKKWAGFMLIE